MHIGIMFDFANPSEWRVDPVEFYRRSIERAVWCEELGFHSVWVPEHHFTDGYPSGTLPILAAMAARTKRVRLGTGILVAPLHHPVRLAEDVATIDVISDGRIEIGLGLGWAKREYECFNAIPTRRISLYREIVTVLRQAWTQDELNFKGEHFTFEGLRVLPKPVQKPHPPLLGGALTVEAARRIGKLGLAFQWTWIDRAHALAYLDGWAEAGHRPEDARIDGYLNLLVCDDPERTWAEVRPHFMYQQSRGCQDLTIAPGGTFTQKPLSTIESIEKLRQDGSFLVMTPEDAVAEIRRRSAGLPVSGFFCFASICGMRDELSQRHIELMATKVMPALRGL